MNSTSSPVRSSTLPAASLRRFGGPKAVQYQGAFVARLVAKSNKAALELRGPLSFVVGPLGTIGEGELVDETYGPIPLVGKISGRDTVLLFTVPDGSVLSAEGTAEEDADNGIGSILGVIALWLPDGSQPYRLGTWNATRTAPVNN